MTRTIAKPASAPLPRRSRTEWDAVIRRRETLNEERLRLNREADDLEKEVAAIDDELVQLIESETTEKSRVLGLANFILKIIWRAPSANAAAFAVLKRFTAEHGAEEVQRIKDSLPRKAKVDITWKTDPGVEAAA